MLTQAPRTSARPYLFTIIAAIIFSKFLQYLWQYIWPEIPLIYGQAPGIYVKSGLIVLAASLWLIYRGSRTRDAWLTVFFGTLIAGWFALMTIAFIHNDGTTYDMLLYVPLVAALWLKTPSVRDLHAAFTFLGWLVAGVLVGTRSAEMLGFIPMVDVGYEILQFEVEEYWLPLAGTIGPEGRWPGPMGHNAMTGNAAAMLVVVAVAMRTRSRWVFGVVGILTLLITASRGSQLGALVGVAAIIVLGNNPVTRRVSRRILLSVVAAVAALAFLMVLIRNPNLTGRTTYWSIALDAWQSSPLIGVGISGFGGDSELAIAGTNAHNLVFDAVVKYGLVGAVFIFTVLISAAWICWRAARGPEALPIGIFAAYFTIGLAGADQGWLGVSLPWLWLVLAVLLAARSWEQLRDGGREPLSRGVGAEMNETSARQN